MSLAPMQLASATSGLTPAPGRPMLPLNRARLVSAATVAGVSLYGPCAENTIVDGGKPSAGRCTLSASTAFSASGAVFWASRPLVRSVGKLLGWVGCGRSSGPVVLPPEAYRYAAATM